MSKLTITSIAFIVLGFICGYIQNTYYGYVDAQGVLHDSLFLPLGVFSLLIGGIFLMIVLVRKLVKTFIYKGK
jgi:hypothetical protein